MKLKGGRPILQVIFITSSVSIFSAFLFSSPLHAQPAESPWPMFRHDAGHTGRSMSAGPRTGALLWTYVTENDVNSSPAVGPDGMVYVGSRDNSLYAFNSDGSLVWTYETGRFWDVASSPALDSDGNAYVGSNDNRVYCLTFNQESIPLSLAHALVKHLT